jgi:hypothetical protein
MLDYLEKYGWIISVVLLAALLVALFLLPGAARGLSWAAIGVSLAAVVGMTVQRRVKAFRQGGMTRGAFVRSLLVDLTGLLLTVGAGWLSARWAGGWAAQAAWERTSLPWVALLASLAAGLAAGMAGGVLVRGVWGLVMGRFRRQLF